jgi:hypothetical protein
VPNHIVNFLGAAVFAGEALGITFFGAAVLAATFFGTLAAPLGFVGSSIGAFAGVFAGVFAGIFAGIFAGVGAVALTAGFGAGLAFAGAGFFATSMPPPGVILIGMPEAVMVVSPFFSCAFSMSFFPMLRTRPFVVVIVVAPVFLASSTADAGTFMVTPDASVSSFMAPAGGAG